jgi:tetratricopeptide (TPR) repeat protein
LSSARAAINAFHSGNLQQALQLYDEALSSDPDNAYLQNLRAYTLFRLGRTDEAIEGEKRSIEIDPNYAWGYFDLARFLCAASPTEMSAAKDAARKAILLRPDIEPTMRSDGEFQRVCRRQMP